MIGLNIINSSLRYNVKKLINLGSACIYPKKTSQPIGENSLYLLLEETNEGYALAKILSLKYCQQHLKKKIKKIYFFNASKLVWRGR